MAFFSPTKQIPGWYLKLDDVHDLSNRYSIIFLSFRHSALYSLNIYMFI